MRKLGLVVLVSCLSAPATLAAAEIPPSGFVVTEGRQVQAGIEYARVARSGPAAVVAHVAHVAPSAAVDLRVMSGNHRVAPDQGNAELTSGMCARTGCAVAVNAGFWDTEVASGPPGGVVSGGRMLRSPGTNPQVTLTGDGNFVAGELAWSAQVAGDTGSPLTVTAVNRFVQDGIALITPDWGDTSPAGPGAELVLQAAEPLGALNQSVAVEAVSLRDRGGDLPAGSAVLAGTGTGEAALRQLWEAISSTERGLTVTVTTPVDAVESIGSHLVLIEDGEKIEFPESDFAAFTRLHRTVLGWNDEGDVFMVTVDSSTADSQGMSLSDVSNLLLDLGATDAVDFDSDGATTMVVEGAVTNRPRGGTEQPAMAAFMAVPRAGGPRFVPPAPEPEPTPEPEPEPPARNGYWMVSGDGSVYAFGDSAWLGNAPVPAGARAVDLEPTPSGDGYWIVSDDGHVYGFGDARWFGNPDTSQMVEGEQVTSLSATPSGEGYWFFTSRGRVLALGDAVHLGDMSAVALNGRVLDSIPTPTGQGYYMVAADGGIFTFGDAVFRGSMGGIPLNAPVQSLVPDPDEVGYWLVASDGGVFSFEGAFRGSMGDTPLNKPVSGMVPYGNGYLMVGEDGGIFNFSDKAFLGSLGDSPPAEPVVSVAAVR